MKLHEAAELVLVNASLHAHRAPDIATLLEEVGEYAKALAGRHADKAPVELVQIGGIVLNLLKHYNMCEVAALMDEREKRRAAEEAAP